MPEFNVALEVLHFEVQHFKCYIVGTAPGLHNAQCLCIAVVLVQLVYNIV